MNYEVRSSQWILVQGGRAIASTKLHSLSQSCSTVSSGQASTPAALLCSTLLDDLQVEATRTMLELTNSISSEVSELPAVLTAHLG